MNNEHVDDNWRIEHDVDRCLTPLQMLSWLKAVEHALEESHYADLDYPLSVIIKAVKRQIGGVATAKEKTPGQLLHEAGLHAKFIQFPKKPWSHNTIPAKGELESLASVITDHTKAASEKEIKELKRENADLKAYVTQFDAQSGVAASIVTQEFLDALRKRGMALSRGMVLPKEALKQINDLEKANEKLQVRIDVLCKLRDVKDARIIDLEKANEKLREKLGTALNGFNVVAARCSILPSIHIKPFVDEILAKLQPTDDKP